MPTRSRIAAAVVWLLCAGGVSSALGTAGDEPIRVGDVVEFRISGVRGASVVTVDDDGCVALPTVGTVNVAGLTADEAADSVSRAYWDLGTTAEVAATVLDSPGIALGAPPRTAAGAAGPSKAAPTTSPSGLAGWRQLMGRVDIGRPVLAGLGATLLAGVTLAGFGLRGRRVDDHPVCRRCRFDLFGLPAGHPRCPECGADLLRRPPRAVRAGNRERRAVALTAGLVLFVPAAAGMGVVGWAAWRGADPYEWKPAWWLARELDSADTKVQQRALAELSNRLQNGKLSRGDVGRAAGRVLGRQADPSRPWSTRFGDFVEDARGAGLLGAEQWGRYLVQGVPAELQPPQRVARGGVFPVKVRVGPARLGSVVQVRVEFQEPAVEVAGRAVDRASLDSISSFLLRDAAAMADGKLTVYDWAQLPAAVPGGVQPVRFVIDLRLRFEGEADSGEIWSEPVRRVEWAGEVELRPPE